MADEQAKPTIKLGKYKHFKGGTYPVLGMGQHTETGEWFVVYQGRNEIRLRSYDNFVQHVEKPEYNYSGPRFTYLYTSHYETALKPSNE